MTVYACFCDVDRDTAPVSAWCPRCRECAIVPGRTFDTRYETGCVVLSSPDYTSSFDGMDSEGVVCSFSVQMVQRIDEGSTA